MNCGRRFVTLYRRQGSRPSPWKRNAKKAKWLSGGLTNSCEKKRSEKKRYKHLNAESQRIVRRDKETFLSNQCKEIEKTTEWERLEISSRKLEIPREHFMQRWAR